MISKSMKLFSITSVLAILSLTAFSYCAPDTTIKVLHPDEKQIEVSRQVASLIANYNYKKVPIGDSLSRLIFDNYLKSLDDNRVYFFEKEVNEFKENRDLMDDQMVMGDLEPAYHMFNIYLERYVNRIQFMIAQLPTIAFDFTKNESLVYNREKLPFMQTQEEMDAYWMQRLKYDLLNLKLAGTEEAKSKETLKKRYENLLSQIAKIESYDAFQSLMTAYTESIDPHTNYFNPNNAAKFNIDMARSLEGIGATLKFENDFVMVAAVVPGGPADKSGQIAIDDKFIAVAQGDGEFVDIVGWRIDNAIQLIRGAKGTTVRLKIVSKGQDIANPKIISIVREKIVLQDQSAKKEIKTIQSNGKNIKIGIIDIPAFYADFKAYQAGDVNYKSTTRDVKLIVDSLKAAKVDAIVVDLRSNGGGSLMEAIDLTGLFLKQGPVVQVRDTKNKIEVGEDDDPSILWDGPMAVLIDRFSASASEIFAAAIQDYGRGIIIGTQSYGKGTVQNSIDLDQMMGEGASKVIGNTNKFGQINLTIAKFYRINGSSTQHKGVSPDIAFPMVFSADKYGESAEPAALPWDEIKRSNYKTLANIAPIKRVLIEKHDKRMKGNKDFEYLLADIKELKLRDAETSATLNEVIAKKERDEKEAESLERDNEKRLARGLAPIKKGEPKPKAEKAFDFMLEESCLIVGDYLQAIQK
ncbi:MAG: carboxy terminal-processing peptidase [Sphingobacteriaceae bacterium]